MAHPCFWPQGLARLLSGSVPQGGKCKVLPWPLGQCGPSHISQAGSLEPALPYRPFQGGQLSFLNPPVSSPRNCVCPPSRIIRGGRHTSESKTLPGNQLLLILQGRVWLKGYLIFTMTEHFRSRLATSACRIKVTSLFSP